MKSKRLDMSTLLNMAQKAYDDKYYFEVIFICYAILEDRTTSLIYKFYDKISNDYTFYIQNNFDGFFLEKKKKFVMQKGNTKPEAKKSISNRTIGIGLFVDHCYANDINTIHNKSTKSLKESLKNIEVNNPDDENEKKQVSPDIFLNIVEWLGDKRNLIQHDIFRNIHYVHDPDQLKLVANQGLILCKALSTYCQRLNKNLWN